MAKREIFIIKFPNIQKGIELPNIQKDSHKTIKKIKTQLNKVVNVVNSVLKRQRLNWFKYKVPLRHTKSTYVHS